MATRVADVIRLYYVDLWSMGDLSAADEIFDPDVVLYGPESPDGVRGIEAIKREVAAMRNAFPDMRLVVDRQVVEGDRALVRWTFLGTQRREFRGMSPTDRPILLDGIDLLHLAGDRITMIWTYFDAMVVYRQRAAAVAAAKESAKAASR